MQEIVRSGIDTKWERAWKATRSALQRWDKETATIEHGKLEYYVAHGKMQQLVQNGLPKAKRPDYKCWESYLEFSLYQYARFHIHQIEIQGMEGKQLDMNNAVSAFTGMCMYEYSKAYSTVHGRNLGGMEESNVLYSAFGVLIGMHDEGIMLARLQIAIFRKSQYRNMRSYPIFTFILRLFADYLGEPPLPPIEGTLKEPVMDVLFDIWRTPDTQMLLPAVLAACDYHTHRCRSGKGAAQAEFEDYEFTRFPIEILLLLRLRELIGLANPQVDHPLMNSTLGRLPLDFGAPGGAGEIDDLLLQVRARMVQDEYDEQSILKACVG